MFSQVNKRGKWRALARNDPQTLFFGEVKLAMMQLFSTSQEKPDVAVLLREGAALLDVRTHEEFVGWHLKGALNIPVEELDNRLDAISKWGIPLLVYSGDDNRSAQATRKLRLHGIEAYDAGMTQFLEREMNRSGWVQPQQF